MSRTTLPFDQPVDHLRITRWHDPAVDAIGHEVRSAYVERFWLPLLGPTTTWLMRRMAAGLEAHPEGFELPLVETAQGLGVGMRGGPSGPFLRAVARTGQFGLTRSPGPAALSVRVRLAPLTHHQQQRLAPHLQAEHHEWEREDRAGPDAEQRRRRARRLALSLLELGEPADAAELQLHRWKVHPAVAHDAMRWAADRMAEVPDLTPETGDAA